MASTYSSRTRNSNTSNQISGTPTTVSRTTRAPRTPRARVNYSEISRRNYNPDDIVTNIPAPQSADIPPAETLPAEGMVHSESEEESKDRFLNPKLAKKKKKAVK